jgi:response regulator of citrate/malate metabolism
MLSRESINVMIVEDDEFAARVYEQFIQKVEGFQVIAKVSSGKQALEFLKVAKPHLILLDIFLPDISGIDLLGEVRKGYKGIDVILITAANDVNTVSEAIRGGAFGYIIKPINIDKFLSTLENYAVQINQLRKRKTMDQTEVDLYFPTQSKKNVKKGEQEVVQLPKGIDKLTLKVIRDKMKDIIQSVSADEVASFVGISYSTVRRYLEYLVTIGEVEVEILYGTVGRPERRYKWINIG